MHLIQLPPSRHPAAANVDAFEHGEQSALQDSLFVKGRIGDIALEEHRGDTEFLLRGPGQQVLRVGERTACPAADPVRFIL
jgi:hypothetical protein